MNISFNAPTPQIESKPLPQVSKRNTLKPPPQDDWKEYFDDEGYPYWFNSRTGESSWEKPF